MVKPVQEKDLAGQILDNARELFSRYGIWSVSMSHIAGYCGISKKTLYRFYNSESMVRAVVSGQVGRYLNARVVQPDDTADAICRLQQLMTLLATLSAELSPLFIRDLRLHYRHMWLYLEAFMQCIVLPDFNALIGAGVADGSFRADLNIDCTSHLYVMTLWSLIESTAAGRYQASEYQSVQAAFNQFFLHGLLSTCGQERYRQQSAAVGKGEISPV